MVSMTEKQIQCQVCKKMIDYYLIKVHLNKHESQILVTEGMMYLMEGKKNG